MDITPAGAWLDEAGAHFTLWAPSATRVELLIEGIEHPVRMTPGANGVFTTELSGPSHGRRYRYRVDGRGPFPDPASRWQPDGVHGASALDDPRTFPWRAQPVDVPRHDLVIYELHVGTFTPEGTFEAAAARLPYLRHLGVTAVELMPVAEFPGTRNWGYDGAALFAPSSAYGGPHGLRGFVDAAHQLGLAVLLDVVYNHLGPDGAYLAAISPEFFAEDDASPWGDTVNLARPEVGDWLTANAAHWAVDYQLDGFRLDATHALPTEEAPVFLRSLISRVRAKANRNLIFIAEDHRNLAEMLRPVSESGWGLDGVWADGFHHQVRVMTAGDRHGYYRDFSGSAFDLAKTIQQGWFYCGQYSAHEGRPRGTDPTGLRPDQFVVCIQNHDQIGNRALGERLHHDVGLDVWRAASALLLFVPETPLLFQGQEWAASSPFQYFTDHHDELGRQVSAGRRNEFRDFPAFSERLDAIPDPQAEQTFLTSRLRWDEAERPPHAGILALYRTLVAHRRATPLAERFGKEAWALDADTVVVASQSEALIARLRGHGTVARGDRLAGTWTTVLTTEDATFTEDGVPPSLDATTITFARPSALLVRRV